MVSLLGSAYRWVCCTETVMDCSNQPFTWRSGDEILVWLSHLLVWILFLPFEKELPMAPVRPLKTPAKAKGRVLQAWLSLLLSWGNDEK